MDFLSSKHPASGSSGTTGQSLPVKVLQFGQGNFIRGFAAQMIDEANTKGLFGGSIVIVKPRKGGSLESFRRQDCRYTVRLTGIKNGSLETETQIISCVKEALNPFDDYETYISYASSESLRFIISNTTEAGIIFKEEPLPDDAPPETFPGKLTQFLYKRYLHFGPDTAKGLIIIPLELIKNNGGALRGCVEQYSTLWGLPRGFTDWLKGACVFASSSVDRIITGYPASRAEGIWNDLGYRDELLVEGERYGAWIIESDTPIAAEFPLDRTGLPVVFTKDLSPYKQLKVRVLNGAHTSFVPVSFLGGNDTVADSMKDPVIKKYIEQTIHSEILPALPRNCTGAEEFEGDVLERFKNPSIEHSLLDISLNATAKWPARCLPTLLDYRERFNALPFHLTFSLAALIAFYTSGRLTDSVLTGLRNGKSYPIRDSAEVTAFFSSRLDAAVENLVKDYLEWKEVHGTDLNVIPGLTLQVTEYLEQIRTEGMRKTVEELFA